jgi:hypothetical protein
VAIPRVYTGKKERERKREGKREEGKENGIEKTEKSGGCQAITQPFQTKINAMNPNDYNIYFLNFLLFMIVW